jgi:putative acetyltransferase
MATVKVMDIHIAQFEIESYDDAFALWQQCEEVGLSDADTRENIQTYLDRNPRMSFIATAYGKVVGQVLAGHDGRRGYIHHLAVHPDCRRKGIGRKLVDRCLTVLADSGIEKCHIFIFSANADGIAFWKSVGWTPCSDIGVISKTIERGATAGADNGAVELQRYCR